MSFETLLEITYYVYWIGFWCTAFATIYHLREGLRYEPLYVLYICLLVSIFSWVFFDTVAEQIERWES